MNIKTLLAVCLLAFSPLALANHASCDCCEKHHMDMSKHEHHAGMDMTKHDVNAKTCKDDCCEHMHKDHSMKMDMSPAAHAPMDMDHTKMDHASMGKTCDDGDCADMCGDDCDDCCDADCGDCCEHMHGEHAEHMGQH